MTSEMDPKEARKRHRASKRVLAGLSREQAAERAGLSLPTWRDVENGEPSVLMASVEKAAAALGVPLADYVGPDVPVTPDPTPAGSTR